MAAEYPNMTETRMFGGFGYFHNGNMCLGIHKDILIIRVGQETAAELVKKQHLRLMDLTGRIMKAWVMLEPEAIAEDEEMRRYFQMAFDFVETLPPK